MRIDDPGIPKIPYLARSNQARIDDAQRAAKRGDLEESARQFEMLFATMLVREMRRQMPDGLFGKGAGADVYEGWFDEKMGEALARRESLGIAGLVKSAMGKSSVAQDGEKK